MPIHAGRPLMRSIYLSGFFVTPLAERIRAWNLDGKISEDDLENALTADARGLVDHPVGLTDWVPIDEVESLVALLADQLGGETGLVEWAAEIVSEWRAESLIDALTRSSQTLVDSRGFIVSQMSELLVRDAQWRYEGGRSEFSVRLFGMADGSPALKSLLGALLAQLAAMPDGREFDVRFEGIDGPELVIFGQRLPVDEAHEQSRLHQAALIA